MLISAVNALTFSPALCAVLLKRGHERGAARCATCLARHRPGARRLCLGRAPPGARRGPRRRGRRRRASPASAWLFRMTPQSFLPAEDQGAFFAAMRLPEGASLNRTEAVVEQVEDIVRPIPGVQGVLSVVGLNFIDYVASSNQAFFVVRLKPYEERTDPAHSVDAIIARAAAAAGRDPGRRRVPVQPAADPRPGQHRRFPVRAARPCRAQSPTDLAAVMRGLLVAANQQPELAGVFTHLRRRHAADLSRHRSRQGAGAGRQGQRHLQRAAVDARRLLHQRLQPFRPHMAGQRPGRDAVPRRHRRHLSHLRAQRTGAMVPMRALAEAQLVQGPQAVIRYNGFRAAIINGAPKPGYQLRPGARRDGAGLRRDAAAGYSFEWTGTALQEKAAGGQTGIVLGLAMLFAYLFLVALYESWNIPMPVLLSVSVGVLGAIVACRASPGWASTSTRRSASWC